MVRHFIHAINFSRRGKAVRLSYDHKGTDEAEGRRIAAAGGLILNSRVNGMPTWPTF